MPKETIKHDPNEPIRTERIKTDASTDQDNQVIVGWGKGLGIVQIGVQEPDAIPGEREGGHFASIDAAQIEQIIASLRRAKRQAYGPRHANGCNAGSICGETAHCPPD